MRPFWLRRGINTSEQYRQTDKSSRAKSPLACLLLVCYCPFETLRFNGKKVRELALVRLHLCFFRLRADAGDDARVPAHSRVLPFWLWPALLTAWQDGSLDPESRYSCQHEEDTSGRLCTIAYNLGDVRDLHALRIGKLMKRSQGTWRSSPSRHRRCLMPRMHRSVPTNVGDGV